MRNIIEIFKRDLSRIGHSVIGLIVVVGLIIVPVLYAWFNIAGSWDPYGNTGNLRVAVANEDAGYESDLIPIKVNIGESVTAALRENDQLGWEFMSEDDAIEGVKSGAYYAAVVIPEDFSADMMTLFSSKVEHSEIVYYENQKASAIAPRVTDKGASTVRKQIDETFTSTVDDIGLAVTAGLLDYMNSDEVLNYVSNLSTSLDENITDLREAADEVGSLGGLTSSTSKTLTSASDLLGQTGTTSDSAAAMLADAKNGVADISGALSGAKADIESALSESAAGFDAVSSSVDAAFDAADAHVDVCTAQLADAKAKVEAQAAKLQETATALHGLSDKATAAGLSKLAFQLDFVANSLGNVAEESARVATRLQEVADALTSGTASVESSRAEIQKVLDEAKAAISGVKGDYDATLKGQADQLASTIDGIVSASSGISTDLDASVNGLAGTSRSLAADLSGIDTALGDTSATLASAADTLQLIKDDLDGAIQSGDLAAIRSLIGGDPEALASALAAPVSLDRKAVYPIENYGSAMAPFYTVLSLWVGGVVLAAMMKVTVDEQTRRDLVPFRLHELYLGRYCLFLLLALAQATLVSAGDICFFRIQCESPMLFVLTAWLASIVFSLMIYTLTVSFGDIGKALAVVLLVMQVAGSGGTFPIEMTADFFQGVYPFLPFTHAINAMHAAMAGAYGMEYWIEMGVLALYLLPSLALGLLLRRPVIRANNWIIEKLESTKLM